MTSIAHERFHAAGDEPAYESAAKRIAPAGAMRFAADS